MTNSEMGWGDPERPQQRPQGEWPQQQPPQEPPWHGPAGPPSQYGNYPQPSLNYVQAQGLNRPAAYGYHPVTGLPYSHKSKTTAGLLSIFFGFFGAGRFYAGHTGLGFAMLIVNIVLTAATLGFWLALAWIWPLIDGICLLAGEPKDKNGLPLR
ncbi:MULTISPECIES: NINE protein [Rhodococcus]|nr:MULTISPECIES: NINE protein [Rhodococcus]